MPNGRRKRAHDPAPSWVWMLLGGGLGLVAAFVIYAGLRPEPAGKEPAAQSPQARTAPQESAVESAKSSDSHTSDSDDAKRFDFYDVLPRYRVVVPGAKPSKATKAPAAAARPGTYVLQVGSFRALKDADRLQARLALLGIESQIQHVAVKDETWHRVRVGPSSDLAKMDRIRRRLQSAAIASVLMRVR